jgi:glycosyltransferase involved in cell wall biosynthesis
MVVDVVIPAFNEEENIGKVVGAIDRNLVRHVVVVDNGSTDGTAQEASDAGAVVQVENSMGYGSACLKGIAWCNALPEPPEVITFMDGDFSDHPEQMDRLLDPIKEEGYDMIIGSRALGEKESGSMTPQQIFGNKVATIMIRIMYRVRFTDLGPFRAIRTEALNRIEMKDRTYGWTVEMQVKAIRKGLKFGEVAVDYRCRGAGQSKVAATLKGTILAGYKIITTILKYA